MKKHTIKLLTVAITLAAILTLTGCPGPVNTIESPVWDDGVVTTEPTCTTEGVKTYTCSNGETRTETIPALGHDMGDKWEIRKNPTCTEKGSKTRKCSRCGETETVEIDALGHEWEEIITDKTKAATCTENGIAVYKCKTCGAIEERTVSKLGHNFGEWTVTKEATCTEKGSKKHTCSCSNCGAEETVEINALGHSYGNWNVTKEATCTEKGSKTRKCTRCGEEEIVEIDALGHDYQGGYCERCGNYEFGNNCYTIKVFTSTEEWQKAHPIDTMQNSKPIYDECKFSFETNNDIPTNLNELIHLKIKYKGYRVHEFYNGAVWLYTDDIENGGVDIIENNITEILLSQN